MKFPILYATLSLAVLIVGCITDGSNSASTPQGFRTDVGSYIVKDGKIITTQKAATYYFCSGSVLDSGNDAPPPDTVAFELNGNALTIVEPFLDTLPSGAIIQPLTLATRVGTGSGLEGTWIYGERAYRVVSGAMTAEDKQKYDLEKIQLDAEIGFSTLWIQFSGGNITTYEDGRTAERFVANWNGLNQNIDGPGRVDSASYNISVRALDKYTVELKGKTVPETVRLTLNNDGTRVYTSDIAGHAEYHFSGLTRTCPNDVEPQWYSQFLLNNAKNGPNVLPKSSAPRIRKFWPN